MRELDCNALLKAEEAYDKAADANNRPKCNAHHLLAAIRAYIDATAPSRAPDRGEVQQEAVAAYHAQDKVKKGRIAESIAGYEAGVQTRLAASHAGDRERWRDALEQIAAQATAYEMDQADAEHGDWQEGFEACIQVARAALAPAAGQDDAGEAGRG